MATAQEAYEQAQAAYAKRSPHGDTSFYRHKAFRTEMFLSFKFGHKKTQCTACNGSGRYDHNGSPSCASCDGTGAETYKSDKAWNAPKPPAIGATQHN